MKEKIIEDKDIKNREITKKDLGHIGLLYAIIVCLINLLGLLVA